MNMKSFTQLGTKIMATSMPSREYDGLGSRFLQAFVSRSTTTLELSQPSPHLVMSYDGWGAENSKFILMLLFSYKYALGTLALFHAMDLFDLSVNEILKPHK